MFEAGFHHEMCRYSACMNVSMPVIAQVSVSARLGLIPGVIVGCISGMLHAFMLFLSYEFDTK